MGNHNDNYSETMNRIVEITKKNCLISDAIDNGIYSMCMLFLRLRNLYKWENCIEPWQEMDSPELLDWIEQREELWSRFKDEEYHPVPCPQNCDPMAVEMINNALAGSGLLYGAGLGKSLKAVFFIAKQQEEIFESNCRVLVLGKEDARELDCPFAMTQDGVIYFRTEPFRYFLWDRVMEPAPSARQALHEALQGYGLLNKCGGIDQDKFKESLDHIVRQEMLPIIHHEIGEIKDNSFDQGVVKELLSAFPGTVVELVVRAVKDTLADVHPEGHLGWIVAQEKRSSLGFYLTYIEGLRKKMFHGLAFAADDFFSSGDWHIVEQAREDCRTENRKRAEIISEIGGQINQVGKDKVLEQIKQEILAPLGIG